MPTARLGDPETSHAAGNSIDADTLRTSQAAVLLVLALDGPTTDVGLIDAYLALVESGALPQQSPSGIRTRRKELVRAGYVIDTGLRHQLISGRHAIVWAVAQR